MKTVYSITIINVQFAGNIPGSTTDVSLYWRAIDDLPGNNNFAGTFPADQNGFFHPPIKIILPGPGEYIITAEACGCAFAAVMWAVKTNVPEPPGNPGVINGFSSLCPGTTSTYSIAPVAKATSYVWTVPRGWVIMSTAADGTSIVAEAGAYGQDGDITVQAVNDEGTSTTSVKHVTVKAGAPVLAAGSIVGNAAPDPSTQYVYWVVDNGYTYTWSVDAALGVIVSGQGTAKINVMTTAGGSGNISVIASNDCGTSKADTFPVVIFVPLGWIPFYVCQQEVAFTLVHTFGSFSSPARLFYDAISKMVYVADSDDAGGSFFKFDPKTPADMTIALSGITGSPTGWMYATAVDAANRRLFVAGMNSGGAWALNVVDESFTHMPYGTDQVPGATQYNRLAIDVLAATIICSDSQANTIAFFDRLDPSTKLNGGVDMNMSDITEGTDYFLGNYHIHEVEGYLWLSGGIRSVGNIAIYSLDLLTQWRHVPVPLAASLPTGGNWGGHYWQNSFYDEGKKTFYMADTGSNKLHVFDASVDPTTTTPPLLATIDFTNTSFPHIIFGFTQDPKTGDLYMSYAGLTDPITPADPTLRDNRLYKINRDTYQMERMYIGIAFTDLVEQDGTTILWGCNQGHPEWDGTSGWDSDGSILKYDRAGSADYNTGWATVLYLQQADMTTTPPTPVTPPVTKPNDGSFPDGDNPAACPVHYKTDVCATDVKGKLEGTVIEFEFDLPSSIVKNPDILIIRVVAKDSDGNAAGTKDFDLSLGRPNYFHDTVMVGGSLTMKVSIEYIGDDGSGGETILHTCDYMTDYTPASTE